MSWTRSLREFRHSEIELQFRYVVDHDTPQALEDRKTCANWVNSPAAWLEENRLSFWRSAIDGGQFLSIRPLALLSWKPQRTWETRSATSRFAASLWDGLTRHGFSKLTIIVRLALNEAKTKALVQRNRAEHKRLVAEFHQVLETYRIGLEAITPMRRLTGASWSISCITHSIRWIHSEAGYIFRLFSSDPIPLAVRRRTRHITTAISSLRH